MHSWTIQVDAVVAGAGTAGASAALNLARMGLSVVLLDAAPFSAAGARWVNGVPPWMFDRAHISRPEQPEVRVKDFAAHIVDLRGQRHVTIRHIPNWKVDMRLLVQRLQQESIRAGVQVFERAKIVEVRFEGERPAGLAVNVAAGEGTLRLDLTARLFVDATGMRGIVRGQVPSMARWCPIVEAWDCCSAAMRVHRLSDEAAARAFLARKGSGPDDDVAYLGVEGGYSVLAMGVHFRDREVELLTGTIADGQYRMGGTVLREFREQHPWIGEEIFGGEGLIPLRRSYDRLGVAGLALVGNSGCQVFPTHGSGIGSGMVAGRILAEQVTRFADPGSSEALWAYTAAFQREIGSVNAAYDVFRRMSQRLSSERVSGLLATGLMSEASMLPGMAQVLGRPPLRELPRMLLAAVLHPGMTLAILPALVRMPLAAAWYRLYPSRVSEGLLRGWGAVAEALVGSGRP